MHIKKLLALLLAIVMMLGLVACADSDDDDEDEDYGSGGKATIVGKWEGELELGEVMDAAMGASAAELGDYFDFSDLSVTMIYTFHDDGEMKVKADKDSMKEMASDVIDIVLDGYEELLDDKGMSWEALGGSKSDVREALEDQFDSDAMDDMLSGIAREGYYRIVDDRIYSTEDEDELEDVVEDESDYMVFELKGNTLVIKDMVSDGDSVEEDMPGIVPITLKRK